MPVYRLHEALSGGDNTRLKMGSTSQLAWVSPEGIEVLLAKGRISVIQAPPLAILPDFKGEKAEAYAEKGILDVNDMADAEDVPSEDFDKALEWSTVGHDSPEASPDFMTTPIGEDIYEVTDEQLED